jgi:hypothetical protein
MKKITTEEFDQKFDNNEDISDYIDWDSAKRLKDIPVRISVDFPEWMIIELEKEAKQVGA